MPPWERYQAATNAPPSGPWAKYQPMDPSPLLSPELASEGTPPVQVPFGGPVMPGELPVPQPSQQSAVKEFFLPESAGPYFSTESKNPLMQGLVSQGNVAGNLMEGISAPASQLSGLAAALGGPAIAKAIAAGWGGYMAAETPEAVRQGVETWRTDAPLSEKLERSQMAVLTPLMALGGLGAAIPRGRAVVGPRAPGAQGMEVLPPEVKPPPLPVPPSRQLAPPTLEAEFVQPRPLLLPETIKPTEPYATEIPSTQTEIRPVGNDRSGRGTPRGGSPQQLGEEVGGQGLRGEGLRQEAPQGQVGEVPQGRLYSAPGMLFDPEFYKDTARQAKQTAEDFTKWASTGAPKERISQLLDAADNVAKTTARTVGNKVRVALPSKMERSALTFLVEAGGDPVNLDTFLKQVVTKNPEAAQAIRFAKSNSGRLAPYVAEVNKQMKAQRDLELGKGVNVSEAPNYIKHAYEQERSSFFDAGPGGSGISTGFKKQRTFATYADAIEAGFKPQTLDAADLIESRVAAGRRLVNRISWGEQLGQFKDPSTQQPVIASMITQPKGTQVAPRGYSPIDIVPGVRVAVHDQYRGLFDALLGRSFVRSSTLGRAALKTEAAIKHGLLWIDTFHASRMMQKQLFLTGKIGWDKGLSLLEYDEPTINRLVKQGDMPPKAAAWWKENKPAFDLGMKNGLNVGKLDEALYAEIIRKELPIMGIDVNIGGRFNRLVFDKLTRGVMVQSYLLEFERAKANNPSWTPEQAASYAAKQINIYYGNLGRQGIFKSQSAQDMLQLAFLAPRWVEGMLQTEARAYKQMGQVPVDLARGKGLKVGPLAKGVGTGLLAYFIATQLMNKFSTGHFTWENEEGHKLDAYIPDPTGKSGGYWLSPFSVAAEVTHDFLRYTKDKGNVVKAGAQIAMNKLSPLARSGKTVVLGTDYADKKILDSKDVYKEAGKSLLPLPLPASGLMSDRPGQTGKQLFGTAGLKVEIADQRGHEQDKIAQQMFGKNFMDLGWMERRELDRQIDEAGKMDQTLQQKYAAAQAATDKEFEKRLDLMNSLSPPVQKWLKDQGIEVSGFESFKKLGGQEIRLTREEQGTLASFMRNRYDEALTEVMKGVPPGTLKPDVERYIRVYLERARKLAWNDMRGLVEGQQAERAGAKPQSQPRVGK